VSFLADAWAWFADAGRWSGPSGIPARTGEHLWLSVAALVIAAVLALPVAVALGHRRRGGVVAMNVANLGRAVPSFALLVFGVQRWGLDERVGVSLAALFALVLLAVPPLVTNTYVGVAGVPDALRECAAGMGMTARQAIVRIELPVAAPLVLAGVRIATLQVVATATLAALVGSGGLGRYIIDGFAVQDYPQVFGGALLVAALALGFEGAFALVQRALVPAGLRATRRPAGARRPRRAVPPPTERTPS
jgi:osmoprotectant transport system permease protein